MRKPRVTSVRRVLVFLFLFAILLFTCGAPVYKDEMSPVAREEGVPSTPQQNEITPSPLTGKTYYMAPNGSDGGSGSTGSPWATFDKAMTVLRSGDT
ncbi:MAG: hypothetical protein M0Z71_10160, partial [Nitrospiraceae bacterium]|nr:hypothetical protein [Nitrospiraceae bacterium]